MRRRKQPEAAEPEVANEPPEEKPGAQSFQEDPPAPPPPVGSRTFECANGEQLIVPEATARQIEAFLGARRIGGARMTELPVAEVFVITWPDGQPGRLRL